MEIKKVAVDAVNLIYQKMCKFMLADSVHHFLICGAVGVFSRIAGFLENDIVGDIEDMFGIDGQVSSLLRKGFLVDLKLSGYTNIDSNFHKPNLISATMEA